MRKLLIALDAPGPAEFIAPVIPLLKKKNKVSIITVHESAALILRKFRPFSITSREAAQKAYAEFSPDGLLVATSSLALGPFVLNDLTRLAKKENKLIICFQDYWGNHRQPQNFLMMDSWDAVLTPDALAKKLLREDSYHGQILVTGSPAFERFKNIKVMSERLRLRRKFKIPRDAFVILYAGTGTPGSEESDAETFRLLIDTVREFMNENENSALIVRPHPRDENPGHYASLAKNVPFVDTSKNPLSDQLLPVADVVVSTYSTSLLHAGYLRLPAVSILLPKAGKHRLEAIHLSDFPPNQAGATIGVYTPSVAVLKNVFRKIKNDTEFRRRFQKNQNKFFAFPKKSATRNAAQAIEKLLSNFIRTGKLISG